METFLIVLAVIALSWRPGAIALPSPAMPGSRGSRPTNEPKEFQFTAPEAVNVCVDT